MVSVVGPPSPTESTKQIWHEEVKPARTDSDASKAEQGSETIGDNETLAGFGDPNGDVQYRSMEWWHAGIGTFSVIQSLVRMLWAALVRLT